MGRLEAFGLLAVKLEGAPIESDPETMWDGRATAAATMADMSESLPSGGEELGQRSKAKDYGCR